LLAGLSIKTKQFFVVGLFIVITTIVGGRTFFAVVFFVGRMRRR
jgi:hypothetical protein